MLVFVSAVADAFCVCLCCLEVFLYAGGGGWWLCLLICLLLCCLFLSVAFINITTTTTTTTTTNRSIALCDSLTTSFAITNLIPC